MTSLKALGLFAAVVVLGLMSLFLAFLGSAIYPGSLKLAASSLCPSGYPDAFVVYEESQGQVRNPNTGTNSSATTVSYTLACMNERGEYTEVGYGKPVVRVGLYLYGVMLLLFVLFLVPIALVRRRSRESRHVKPAGPIS